MLMSAVALFGLSRLGVTTSPNDTIPEFVVLGLGLSPVIVGATDVIVGNAPVQLAGVAGGLQSTAFQVGGTLGTAVLGAVMSAKVSTLLPATWRAAHLPALTSVQLAEVKGAVVVGMAPLSHGTPRELASVITHISHVTFVSGMHAAFLVAAAVALAGAVIGMLTRRGDPAPQSAEERVGAAERTADALVDGVGLAVDAVGVDPEHDGDAVPGAAGDFGRGDADVEQQADGCVVQADGCKRPQEPVGTPPRFTLWPAARCFASRSGRPGC
jgi:hypothetical protein